MYRVPFSGGSALAVFIPIIVHGGCSELWGALSWGFKFKAWAHDLGLVFTDISRNFIPSMILQARASGFLIP